MALKIITVSLSASGNLAVAPHECNVDAEPGHTSRLVWVLDDGGTDARFVLPNDGKGDGFAWKGAVDPNIFGKAHIIGRGKVIIASDHHFGANNRKEQPYVVRVLDDAGNLHVSRARMVDGRPKDPVIINR